jgi:sugar-specific transcriptional regulator TrmB
MTMQWQDFDMLSELGLNAYERKALAQLMLHGVADAETLCREAAIPTSKIYQAMEKLNQMGLADIQPTRPKLYAALPGDVVADRLVEISRQNTERFAKKAEMLRAKLSSLPERAKGRRPFVDLALGVEGHVKRHVMHLATAQRRILSYLEQADLSAIDEIADTGLPVLRRVARNAAERNIDHRIVFGFGYHTAPQLVTFLKKYRPDLEHATGVRYSGELGHPFHVIDDDSVVLGLSHPFIPEKRFASILIRDKELAGKLAQGFETLWSKAMRSLQEIDFHPSGRAKT